MKGHFTRLPPQRVGLVLWLREHSLHVRGQPHVQPECILGPSSLNHRSPLLCPIVQRWLIQPLASLLSPSCLLAAFLVLAALLEGVWG